MEGHRLTGRLVLLLLALTLPTLLYGQPGPPPVGAALVREGEFAVDLVSALGVGNTADEVEAESLLGGLGIAPRNGWIADYPVTPDIIGELQKSVIDAVDSRRLPLTRDEALQKFADVNVQASLSVVPYDGNPDSQGPPLAPEEYPNPVMVNDYYATEGPPIVTYYTPPPDYYYLYGWVPYPFWCHGFWFPGFFVLNDFHRIVHFHNRPFFVSNHFNDVRAHRFFRIDPHGRFTGHTFAGIGAPRSREFIPSGIPGSDRKVFNAPRTQTMPGSIMRSPSFSRPGMTGIRSMGASSSSTPGSMGGSSHGGGHFGR
jgi:hypothetical protein